jgi:hypothetical protein
MRNRSCILVISGALALLGAGCGEETSCGEGTVEMNGTCIPADTACGTGTVFNEETGECEGISCADGTVLMGDECVPDGSVVCGDGTTFDPDAGECVPDLTCGEGTVLVDGECVPYDDSLDADVNENPEPNGFADDNAGMFTLPSIGGPVTIKGCVNPYEDADANACFATNLDPDYDAYFFVVDHPTLLSVTVDGLNGLSGGFLMLSGDDELFEDAWVRIGVNPADDTATRQVFLPKEGIYALGITDGRSILLDEGFGSPDDCYLATVEELPIPAPTAMSGATASGNLGDVQFFSYGDVDEGDLLYANLDAPSSAAVSSVLARVEGDYRSSGDTDAHALGAGAGDEVVFVVDHVYNYSLAPVPFTLRVDDQAAQALPTAATATLTWHEDHPEWLYWDAASTGEMWHLLLDSLDGEYLYIDVLDARENVYLGTLYYGGGESTTSFDDWIRVPASGRYYLEIYNDMEEPLATFGLASATSHYATAGMTLGTEAAGQAPNADNTNWYTVNVTAADWLLFQADTSALEGGLGLTVYDGNDFGVINDTIDQFDDFDLYTDEDIGRITRGLDVTRLLISATDSAEVGGTFDLTVGERDYTTISVTYAAGSTQDDLAIGANENQYYMVEAPERDAVVFAQIANNASEYLEMWTLYGDESFDQDATVDDITSSDILFDVTAREYFIPIRIWEGNGAAGTYDLSVGAYPPAYSVTDGTAAFVDVCECGLNSHQLWDDDGVGESLNDDDGLTDYIPLDEPFYFFGTEVTSVVVSSNGYVTFDPDYWNNEGRTSWFPEYGFADGYLPDFLAAPFATDIDHTTVCVRQDADRVTVQWSGEEYTGGPPGSGAPVSFQLVLHDSGLIDFVYGDGHELDSAAAIIGLENPSGTYGRTISDFQSGFAAPGSSYNLEINPE